MRDPYVILGVSKTASAEEIKSAYRKLARAKHPDVNPGDPKAEEEFREISAAYDLLGDTDKRRRFDAGELDANGNERFHAGAGAGGFGGQGFGGFRSRGGGAGPGGMRFESFFGDDDVFSDLFNRASQGGGGGGRQRQQPRKGEDVRYRLNVSFAEACAGASRTVTLSGGKTLNVKIPAGAEHRQTLRLKGQGNAPVGGGQPGDALIEILVKPHAAMRRDGLDIHADVPVSIGEAINGAKIPVRTPTGKVMVTVPPGSNGDTQLRLRGKGIAKDKRHGDFIVHLRLMLDNPAADTWKDAAQEEDPEAGANARDKAGLS